MPRLIVFLPLSELHSETVPAAWLVNSYPCLRRPGFRENRRAPFRRRYQSFVSAFELLHSTTITVVHFWWSCLPSAPSLRLLGPYPFWISKHDRGVLKAELGQKKNRHLWVRSYETDIDRTFSRSGSFHFEVLEWGHCRRLVK